VLPVAAVRWTGSEFDNPRFAEQELIFGELLNLRGQHKFDGSKKKGQNKGQIVKFPVCDSLTH
jgi:hypothetical protein